MNNIFDKINANYLIPCLVPESLSVNERGVEIILGSMFGHNNQNNFIEVGAVLPYYLKDIYHEVIDPYDPYDKCIRIDAESYDFTDKNVLCISTIEHMGTEDYGNKDVDQQKPIRFLDKLYSESNKFLATFPLGSNKFLDEYIFNYSNLRYKVNFYYRTSYEPPIWRFLSLNDVDRDFLRQIKYNEPFPNGNCIAVITKE